MNTPVHLLCVVGLAPAVVSETAWAITQEGQEIVGTTLVTTAAAAPGLRSMLEPDGPLARAIAPAPKPPVTVEVISRSGTGHGGSPVTDIRSAEDHRACVSALDRIVRGLTSAGSPPLHASIAGGRKTMASALGLVMALHARPADRISHVLVAPPFDADPGFLFPLPGDTEAEAAVTLIDVPFIRLRPLLPNLDCKPLELIGRAQERLSEAAPAILNLKQKTLAIGEQHVALKPIGAALLALIAEASKFGTLGVGPTTLDLKRLQCLYLEAGAPPSAASGLIARLAKDGPDAWMREHVSRLRSDLSSIPTLAIVRVGRRPSSRYRILGRSVETIATQT